MKIIKSDKYVASQLQISKKELAEACNYAVFLTVNLSYHRDDPIIMNTILPWVRQAVTPLLPYTNKMQAQNIPDNLVMELSKRVRQIVDTIELNMQKSQYRADELGSWSLVKQFADKVRSVL